ncbi:MAG TPA: CPBP family glutamic-type intramembrane protease [Methylomirabilota bacterium]|jgi:hypothetical protein
MVTHGAARSRFHACLALVLLPVIALPVEWWLALRSRRDSTSPDDHRWSARVFAVACADTLVAGIVIGLIAAWWMGTPALPGRPTSVPATPKLRVGAVAVDAADGGARVCKVLAGAPADRGGLREGDVIVAVDGTAVPRFDRLVELIDAGAAGEPRTLRIIRTGVTADITVAPEARRPLSGAELFTPWLGAGCSADRSRAAMILAVAQFVVAPVVMLGTWLFLRIRRAERRPLWRWVALALGGAVVAHAVVDRVLFAIRGGDTPAAPLLGAAAGQLIEVIVAIAAVVVLSRGGQLTEPGAPRLSSGRVLALGAFYYVAFGMRLRFVLLGLAAFWPVEVGAHPLWTAGVAMGWEGKLVLVVIAVVLAPIGEELLFRGLVLPRLQQALGTVAGVALTSLLFAVLHLVYGAGMAIVFLLSVVLCWARLRTGGVRVPILLHAANNLVVTLIAFTR